jgi:uncharacterized protein YaaQ
MSTPLELNRLVILIVSGAQFDLLVKHLAREKFTFTVINTTGGMIQETEVCLLIGFHSDRLPTLLEVIRKDCHPYRQYVSSQGIMQGEKGNPPMVEVELGGARIYMMNVERYEQI